MSREYQGKRIVVYPNYIDSKKSRKMGRKISFADAVSNPKIEEIVRAAENLGLEPQVDESRYPREWWSTDKRVIVLKRDSKLNTLRLIAREIKRLREKY
ncbi:MAG: signal recognition particle protein Srp19 [Crenarchaeota archaeon]|nr:signal recognition particle protein Srp19 [Thermoproteota archaeon]